MTLPRKFKVRTKHGSVIYTIDNDGASCRVTWDTMLTPGGVTYNTDVVEKHVSNGTWKIIEEVVAPVADPKGEKQMSDDVTVGSRVKIVDIRHCYDHYKAWAKKHELWGWEQGERPEEDSEGVVVCIASHEKEDMDIYGISNDAGQTFILARDGFKVLDTAAPVVAPVKFRGVDTDGKPKDFSHKDFAAFQRVELYNGGVYVVVQAVRDAAGVRAGEWIAVQDGGWMDLRLEGGGEDEWAVKAIYEPPLAYSYLLDPEKKGDLLWQAEDVQAKQKRAETLQEELVQAAHNVRDWQERMERIKQELQAI